VLTPIFDPMFSDFSGFSFTVCSQVKLRIAPKTRTRFKEKIRKLTSRSWGVSMEKRMEKLNAYLLGWSGYFRIAETISVLPRVRLLARTRASNTC